MAITKAACIGGGVIGAGWVARLVLNGIDVAIFDPDPEAKRKVGEVMKGAKRAYRKMATKGLPKEGRITYANEVFLRVAAYEEHEVMGKPHSIIRHPDMPRAVFGLLWKEIQAGNEIFAYVNNLAKDGVNYWVFAHVTPTWRDGRIVGYHSNRRVPDPAAVHAVEPIYRQLLAEEQRHHHPVEAIDASTALLGQVLAGAGVTYDEFVWSLAGASA